MGDPDRAVESYSRALTIDPTFAGSHIGRAWSLASLGRYDDAILEQPPQSLLASWSSVRALVLSRVGRYREADQAIEAGRREAEISENAGEQGNLFLVSSLLAIERADVRARAAGLRVGRTPVREFAGGDRKGRPRAGSPDERDRAGQGRPHGSSSSASRDAGTALQRRRRTRELVAQRVGRGNHVGRWRPREGGVRIFRWAALEKDVVQHPECEPVDSGEQSDVTRWTRSCRTARGDLNRAIQIYRQLLSYGPDQKWVSVFEPRYVLEMAGCSSSRENSQPH